MFILLEYIIRGYLFKGYVYLTTNHAAAECIHSVTITSAIKR